ncbi:MAG TPA: methyltransferase [Acidobacteriaceae bacterium]|jgi:ubiquinone/menaquinone biosynthesis C-methylase UbiE
MPVKRGIGNVTANSELLEMAMAFGPSCMVSAAARLGVADALGDGERSASDIAAACQADATSMYRLLRAMAVHGLLTETQPQHFRLTEMGQALRKDAPDSGWAGVIFWSDLLADMWSQLGECVRTGKNAARVMETSGRIPRWSQDPNASDIFRAVMGTAPAENYAPIVDAWPFPTSGVVADLGGGGGALIRAVLERHAGLRGMLVDRPESIANAEQIFNLSPVADRCQRIAADLCEAVPPGADVLMLKHVLHGYTDEKAVEVLRNCRRVLPSTGSLLVIEFVLPDVVSKPAPELVIRFMSDLNMMAVTGGRERSEPEWSQLLKEAGFTLARNIPVKEMDVSILEARPIPSLE